MYFIRHAKDRYPHPIRDFIIHFIWGSEVPKEGVDRGFDNIGMVEISKDGRTGALGYVCHVSVVSGR